MLLSTFGRRLFRKYILIAVLGGFAGIIACSTGGSESNEALESQDLADDLAKLEMDSGAQSEANVEAGSDNEFADADTSKPEDGPKKFDQNLDTSTDLKGVKSPDASESSEGSASGDAAKLPSETGLEKQADSDASNTNMASDSSSASDKQAEAEEDLTQEVDLPETNSESASSVIAGAETSSDSVAAVDIDEVDKKRSGENIENVGEATASGQGSPSASPASQIAAESSPAREGNFVSHPAEKKKGYSEDLDKFVYTVEAGDTLFRIALKLYGKGSLWSQLAEKNGLKNPSQLYPGQKLEIDIQGEKSRKFARNYIKVTWEKAGDYNQVRPDGFATITVKAGWTLSKISQEIFGDTKKWARVMALNQRGIKNPNLIYIGQRIHLRVEVGDEETEVAH